MWSLFTFFPRKQGTSTFFLGPNKGVWGGGQEGFFEQVYVPFLSLTCAQNSMSAPLPQQDSMLETDAVGFEITTDLF